MGADEVKYCSDEEEHFFGGDSAEIGVIMECGDWPLIGVFWVGAEALGSVFPMSNWIELGVVRGFLSHCLVLYF